MLDLAHACMVDPNPGHGNYVLFTTPLLDRLRIKTINSIKFHLN